MNRGNIDSQKFIDTLEECGFEPRSYSGRGMYGKNCIGVATDDIFDLGFQVESALSGEDIGHIPPCRTDSMGMDTIVYRPDLAWPEDDSDDTEEES